MGLTARDTAFYLLRVPLRHALRPVGCDCCSIEYLHYPPIPRFSTHMGCVWTPWSGPFKGSVEGCPCQTCVKRMDQDRPQSKRKGCDEKPGTRTYIAPFEQGRTTGRIAALLITRRSQVQILPPLRRKPLALLHVSRVFSRPDSLKMLMSNLCQTLATDRMGVCQG